MTDDAGNVSSDSLEVRRPSPERLTCPDPTRDTQLPGTEYDTTAAVSAVVDDIIDESVPSYNPDDAYSYDPSIHPNRDLTDEPYTIVGANLAGSISYLPAGGISLDNVICLVPTQTTADETEGTVVDEDSVVYANTATDTDTFIRPVAGGVATVHNIRGPGHPTTFSWEVALGDGLALQELTNGDIAIINPNRPAPSDLVVPDAPEGQEEASLLRDAATQVALKKYRILVAEEETDHEVQGVLVRPWGVDSSGDPLSAAYDVSGTTVSITVPTAAEALVTVVSDDNGPPTSGNFYYISEVENDAILEQARRQGGFYCVGQRKNQVYQPFTQRFYEGGVRVSNSDNTKTYGTATHAALPQWERFISNSVIRKAYAETVDGYFSCWPFMDSAHIAWHRMRLVYGNHNQNLSSKNDITPGRAFAVGTEQVDAMWRFYQSYLGTRSVFVPGTGFVGAYWYVAVGVGSDLEAWGHGDIGAPMAHGASAADPEKAIPFYDFGDTKECGTPKTCDNGWTWERLAAASRGWPNAHSVLEVYNDNSASQSSVNAVKNVVAWYDEHADEHPSWPAKYRFDGITGADPCHESGHAPPYLGPKEAWSALDTRIGRLLNNRNHERIAWYIASVTKKCP